MAIVTGRFMWNFRVTAANNKLDFKRLTAGTTYVATLALGNYLPKELATEIARAMQAGDTGGAPPTYGCTFDFATRKFTITTTTTFDLLFGTGANAATSCGGLLGFVIGGGAGNDFINPGPGTKTSTDAVGAGSSTAKTWAPVDPVVSTSPVAAAADGSAATLLQRSAKGVTNRADGGLREQIWFSTDKLLTLEFKYVVSGAEQTSFELLLDWLEKGGRVNYQPDATSTNALRLALANPGDLLNHYSWLTRNEIDYPVLQFVEQLSRT